MCYKCGGRGYTKKGKIQRVLIFVNYFIGKACKVCYYRKHGGNCPLCYGKKMIYGKSKIFKS